MKLLDFPHVTMKGNSVVKVYRHLNAVYDEFKVACYAHGKRKLESFADFEKAKKRAEKINDSVNNGNTDTLTLTGKDLITFTRVVTALKPTSIPLDLAAIQFAKVVEILRAFPGVACQVRCRVWLAFILSGPATKNLDAILPIARG